mmetsp:Transcript_19814/g.28192  ORF Transcript_19814/g.28192 Transcript_19814/m.28192 type:complete len:115 (+) Transcript_19814:158-502(+)
MVELASAATVGVIAHHLPFAVHGAAGWPAGCCICEAINETLWFAWEVATCPVHFFCPCFCGPMVAVASLLPIISEENEISQVLWTEPEEEVWMSSNGTRKAPIPSLLDHDNLDE